MEPLKYTCSKCGNRQFETGEARTAGSFVTKIFNIKNRKFTTITCTQCKYTEFFAAESNLLGNILDFFYKLNFKTESAMDVKKIVVKLIVIISLTLLHFSCSKDGSDPTINIFTINDDIAFGNELQNEIRANPADYPVLDSNQYSEAYHHIYRIRDSILQSNVLIYADVFNWRIDIIRNDTILNAFCAPGGYICVYTGIIKFLDNESQFAGVMGHEMAHADRRHSTDQLTKVYGIDLLLGIILGNNPSQLAEIAANLAAGVATLAFSRDAEYESDEYSVRYLYTTAYDARGVGGFFQKLDGSPQPPEFLSTHPHPDNRYDKIIEIWEELGGKEGETFESSYNDFKNSLP